MRDEGALERWLRLEAQNLSSGLVTAPALLDRLLAARDPQAQTRGGEPHRFDLAALRVLAERLPPLTRSSLRLPILFYLDREARGSCFISDPPAQEALRACGVQAGEPRDGRLWLGEPLARAFAARFPTLAQFVFL